MLTPPMQRALELLVALGGEAVVSWQLRDALGIGFATLAALRRHGLITEHVMRAGSFVRSTTPAGEAERLLLPAENVPAVWVTIVTAAGRELVAERLARRERDAEIVAGLTARREALTSAGVE